MHAQLEGGRPHRTMKAQGHTNDFDSILALAPAINWDGFITMGLWLYMVITLEGGIVPVYVFNTFKEYAIHSATPTTEPQMASYPILKIANLMQRA